ncbi:hypothetical protein NDU88_001727, partial [Pleurodeles waltl]
RQINHNVRFVDEGFNNDDFQSFDRRENVKCVLNIKGIEDKIVNVDNDKIKKKP